VLARCRLRIAIEPAFKGLSFRRREGGSMVGLDVEYAEAFARHPGEAPADIVWSALPPSAAFEGIAYSRA